MILTMTPPSTIAPTTHPVRSSLIALWIWFVFLKNNTIYLPTKFWATGRSPRPRWIRVSSGSRILERRWTRGVLSVKMQNVLVRWQQLGRAQKMTLIALVVLVGFLLWFLLRPKQPAATNKPGLGRSFGRFPLTSVTPKSANPLRRPW